MYVFVLVCRRCPWTRSLAVSTAFHRERDLATVSAGCPSCGNPGSVEMREAVVVEAVVPPAETYPWTFWLDDGKDVRRVCESYRAA